MGRSATCVYKRKGSENGEVLISFFGRTTGRYNYYSSKLIMPSNGPPFNDAMTSGIILSTIVLSSWISAMHACRRHACMHGDGV